MTHFFGKIFVGIKQGQAVAVLNIRIDEIGQKSRLAHAGAANDCDVILPL